MTCINPCDLCKTRFDPIDLIIEFLFLLVHESINLECLAEDKLREVSKVLSEKRKLYPSELN